LSRRHRTRISASATSAGHPSLRQSHAAKPAIPRLLPCYTALPLSAARSAALHRDWANPCHIFIVTWLTSALLYVPQPLATPAQVPVLVTVTVLPRASASQEVATNNKPQLGEVEHRAWPMASSLEATYVGQCVFLLTFKFEASRAPPPSTYESKPPHPRPE